MADIQPVQRAASVPAKPSDLETIPKRTFTLPTGEPVTVIPVAPPAPVVQKQELLTVVEPATSAPVSPHSMVIKDSPVVAPIETLAPAPAPTPLVLAEEPKRMAVLTEEPQQMVEKNQEVVEKYQKVAVLAEEPQKMVVIPAATPKPAEAPVLVTATAEHEQKVVTAPAAMIVPSEVKKVEIVEKPATVIEKRSSMPVLPSTQMVEEKVITPAAVPVVVPVKEAMVQPVIVPVKEAKVQPVVMPAKEVVVQQAAIIVPGKEAIQEVPVIMTSAVPAPSTVQTVQTAQFIGTLEPLKRRIAIFSSYVALSSTTIRFGNRFHQDLLDAAGHPIFHLHDRHKLSDEHGAEIVCLHKSLCLGRWHAESMKHQTRLLTARRKEGGVSMRLTIENCFTDKTEDLLYLRGKLYDGMDPTINRVAVMFDRDGVVQVAKGFDVSIAAILAFVINAWEWRGSKGCCF